MFAGILIKEFDPGSIECGFPTWKRIAIGVSTAIVFVICIVTITILHYKKYRQRKKAKLDHIEHYHRNEDSDHNEDNDDNEYCGNFYHYNNLEHLDEMKYDAFVSYR